MRSRIVFGLVTLLACAKERPPVEAPLPAPKRMVEPKLGPALTETKRLVDALIAMPCEHSSALAEQLRQWSYEGWFPAETKRRALFTQIESSLPQNSDFAGAALLEGRAMESLADDWRTIAVEECQGDPVRCDIGARVATDAFLVWIDRAQERYATCAKMSGEDLDMEDFCAAKVAAMRRRFVIR